jgi:hypothetical protein
MLGYYWRNLNLCHIVIKITKFVAQLVFILLEMGEGGDLQYSGMQKFRVECDSQSLGFWVSYFSLHKQASNLN